MMQRLLTFAAAVSMLIAVAALVGWVATAFWSFSVLQIGPRNTIHANLVAGGVSLGVEWETMTGMTAWEEPHLQVSPPRSFNSIADPNYDDVRSEIIFIRRGFVVHLNRTDHYAVVMLPCWFIILLSIPLPALWVRARRVRRRSLVGCCKACGYDLRGSPPGGDCPECGAKRAAEAGTVLDAKAP
ncbi:MAG: hypothetical protein NTW19_09665 [Planctomycetota bacterium]|nr:hypothetical protein [Planctomycetota bacterium]